MVRPRSRARATHETTDAGFSVSSVSRRATSAAAEGGRPPGPRRRAAPSLPVSSPGRGRLGADRRQHALPAQRDPALAGGAGDVGVKGAVEDAGGVLGAREVAAQPEQLLGDPGQHSGAGGSGLLLLLGLALPAAP